MKFSLSKSTMAVCCILGVSLSTGASNITLSDQPIQFEDSSLQKGEGWGVNTPSSDCEESKTGGDNSKCWDGETIVVGGGRRNPEPTDPVGPPPIDPNPAPGGPGDSGNDGGHGQDPNPPPTPPSGEEERKQCLASAEATLKSCTAEHLYRYSENLLGKCKPLIESNVSVNIGPFSGGVGQNRFEQCEKIEAAQRDAGIGKCEMESAIIVRDKCK